jgi:uncharacterized membrane protein YdjX (TVP38/TMEM64 family)
VNTARPDSPGISFASPTGRLLTLLALVCALLTGLYFSPWGDALCDREVFDQLANLARAGDYRASLCFVLVSSLLIMIGTPRLIFFTFGGFAFGLWSGLCYSLGACLAGSFLAFSLARWGARAWLAERFGDKRLIKRIVAARPSIPAIALFRFLPISNALVNIGLALSAADSRQFLLGSLLGYLPQGLIAVLIGSGLAENSTGSGALQMGMASVLLLIVVYWTARMRRQKA